MGRGKRKKGLFVIHKPVAAPRPRGSYKPRPRSWTDADLKTAVTQSLSKAEVIKRLGLKVSGGSYELIARHIERLGIDTSHFKGQGYLKGKKHGWTTSYSLEEILIEGSTYTNRSMLKKRLIAADLLRDVCYDCGRTHWRGRKLSLQLEHKNGVRNDNRIGNLSLLCPNCHSLTPTFSRGAKGLLNNNAVERT